MGRVEYCAPCLMGTNNYAAHVVFINSGPPMTSESLHERGDALLALIARVQAGDDPKRSPEGRFEINHTETDLRAVTTFKGTAVCLGHLAAAQIGGARYP